MHFHYAIWVFWSRMNGWMLCQHIEINISINCEQKTKVETTKLFAICFSCANGEIQMSPLLSYLINNIIMLRELKFTSHLDVCELFLTRHTRHTHTLTVSCILSQKSKLQTNRKSSLEFKEIKGVRMTIEKTTNHPKKRRTRKEATNKVNICFG